MPTLQKRKSITRISVCSPSYIPFKSHREPYPVLTLSGQWLQEAGFHIGCVANVSCKRGKLIVTVAKEQQETDIQKRCLMKAQH